ncbi:hypothetical protein L3Y34_012662 [Caenorhabditis briggsae]|uniref:Uncharacterized protein n=1 Tax=Caenorhabditis briggsae TaxID=6238 RepID=A0AAE8ZRX8_CAEBR|nr:hypothetical protein L3Y34_012662 [Caenorhabditis briggsae]
MPDCSTQTPRRITERFHRRNLSQRDMFLYRWFFQELVNAQANLFEIEELRHSTLSIWVMGRTEIVREILQIGSCGFRHRDRRHIDRLICCMHQMTRTLREELEADAAILSDELIRREYGIE